VTEYPNNNLTGESFAGAVVFDQRNQLDTLSVETPEQVDLRLPVAGIGSRLLAHVVDVLILVIAYVLLLLLIALTFSGKPAAAAVNQTTSAAENWWIAGIIFVHFAVVWGYFVLFEAFWRGQTPGKAIMKLRVIKDSGRGITLFESMARNLMRVVDLFPGFYLTGVIAMLCNRSAKRLGDMVAGTLVVHERPGEQPLLTHNSRTFTAGFFPEPPRPEPFAAAAAARTDQALPSDAVARLKSDDLHLIETFFARALDLTVERRAELAARVAATICTRMAFVRPESLEPERLLETVAYRMRGQARF
jgi:uncharacterized RDD family membrane protein YckC